MAASNFVALDYTNATLHQQWASGYCYIRLQTA